MHTFLNETLIMKNKLHYSYLKPWFKKNLTRGFTLSELMIVIVVTGFLPAVVMPWYLNHYDLLQQQTVTEKLAQH